MCTPYGVLLSAYDGLSELYHGEDKQDYLKKLHRIHRIL